MIWVLQSLSTSTLVLRSQVRKVSELQAQGSPFGQTRVLLRQAAVKKPSPSMTDRWGFSLCNDSQARPPETTRAGETCIMAPVSRTTARWSCGCIAQLIVDRKLLKAWCFLKPHYAFQLSPAVRTDHVGVGALFSFPSVPSLRVLLSFLKQCFSYIGMVLAMLQMSGEYSLQQYPAISDISRCLRFTSAQPYGSSQR
jgi:hypothetical protein